MTKYDVFKLDDEHVEFIINKTTNIEPYITKITYEISPNIFSNSYYLRIYHKDINVSLRLSDHDTYLTSKGGGIHNRIIGKRTTNKQIIDHITKAMLQSLKHKYDSKTLIETNLRRK